MNKTISLQPDIIKEIEALAHEEKRSFSAQVSIILEKHVKDIKRQETPLFEKV